MVAFSKVAIAAFTGLVAAHPGEKHDAHHLKREIAARDNYARFGARSLANCAGSTQAQALKARSIERRAKRVDNLRQKRGITGGKSNIVALRSPLFPPTLPKTTGFKIMLTCSSFSCPQR